VLPGFGRAHTQLGLDRGRHGQRDRVHLLEQLLDTARGGRAVRLRKRLRRLRPPGPDRGQRGAGMIRQARCVHRRRPRAGADQADAQLSVRDELSHGPQSRCVPHRAGTAPSAGGDLDKVPA
jgi:hypothetical protein